MDWWASPKNFKRIIYSFSFLTLNFWKYFETHDSVYWYDCFKEQFPLILGFDSGDTENKFIDQDPLIGYIFMVWMMTAKEFKVPGALKSVFISQHTCSKFNFIKII